MASDRSTLPTSAARPSCAPPGRKCLILVPAFNEGGSVRRLVERLRRAVPGYDVLVIDDGSTDDTVRQVPEGTAVVTLPFNLGIGGAMQAGYRYAALHGYDVAVQVDGDGQHRPREVRRLVAALAATPGDAGADLVIGSRFAAGGGDVGGRRYRQTVPRAVGAWVIRAVIRTFTGLPVTDVTSGFRAANRRAIRAFAHWYPEDYPEPEVILLLHRAGYRVGEVGVRMRQRRAGRTSIRPLDGLFYVAKVTVCLVLDMARRPWPQGRVLDAGGGTAQSTGGLAWRADAGGRLDAVGRRTAAGSESTRPTPSAPAPPPSEAGGRRPPIASPVGPG